MIKRASQKSGECLYLVTEEVYCKATSFNLLLDVVESQLSCLGYNLSASLAGSFLCLALFYYWPIFIYMFNSYLLPTYFKFIK
jgi:hypothetical protein